MGSDRDIKLTSVRYAVYHAYERSMTAYRLVSGYVEGKLKLAKFAQELRSIRVSVISTPVLQAVWYFKILGELDQIERCGALLRGMGFEGLLSISHPVETSVDRESARQIGNLENALSKDRNLVLLCKELERRSKMPVGAKSHVEKRVFVSEIVGWWYRNTGKWPSRNPAPPSGRDVDPHTVDFYTFLEAARLDAGLTAALSSSSDQTGPFERMVRDVIPNSKRAETLRMRRDA